MKARMKRMPIPKWVRLPWYPVRVYIISRQDIAKNCHEPEGKEGADGYFDRDTNPAGLYIADDLSIAKQRYVLYHELGHAWNDAMDTFLDTYTMSEQPENHPMIRSANDATVV